MSGSFLQRYKAGEYIQVWDDLQSLGPVVYHPHYYDQARAVAQETMRRVCANIERLIPRLQQVGYIFGYEWAQPIIQEEFSRGGWTLAQDWVADQPPLFALPQPETSLQLQQ
ncbi:MAG TPA: hypothetical protein VKB76_17435, partial [Ktedonobacterales bacterium]|nr:hypothetical protein [Ktedonobacterales bacterium]